MSVSRTISSLRKLGHFLVALFPWLGGPWERLAAAARRRLEKPLSRLQSPRGRAVAVLVEQFFWSDYQRDRVDFTSLGMDGAALLRPLFLASLAACVALPLALAAPGPTLPASAVDGATTPVAIASVLLWLVALPLAWGRLLAGAAASNRVALVSAAAPYLYFTSLAAIGLPPSPANLFAPLTALFAAAAAERRLGREEAGDRARGLVACALVGAAAGVGLTAFTTLGRFAFGHKVLVGIVLGVALGGLAFVAGRRRAERPPLPLARLATILGALTLTQLLTVVARGDLGRFADNSTMLFRLLVGYLWPAWYFIGVGAIFELLKTTRILTAASRALLPARWFVPSVLLVLLGLAVVFASGLIVPLASLGAPPWLLLGLVAVKHWSLRWLWSQPAAIIAAEWMRWVVLLDGVAVIWLAARRRLSTEAVASLASNTLLAWLLVYEYQCQLAGFARSGSHSALLLSSFVVWLLWLLHKVALRLGRDSSPHWPSAGRLAIAGALLCLVLISVEARAAIGDAHLTDEIFLYLFLGVIDVGLPYFLLVYAGRRLRTLPLATHQILGAFCLGAALTLPLSALDHLVAAGSFPALSAELDRRAQALLTVGALPPIHTLPALGWLVARGVLVVGALAALAALVFRRTRARRDRAAVVLFAVVAAATGLASFAKARADLPLLPSRWVVLLTPDRQSMAIDLDLIVTYLGHALPALVLALVVDGGRAWRWILGVALALALHLAWTLAWPREEAWLRATGLGETLAVAGIGALLALLVVARRRVEATAPTVEKTEGEEDEAGSDAERESRNDPWALPGRRARYGLLLAFALGLGALGVHDLRAARQVTHDFAGLGRALPLPVAWSRAPQAPPGLLALFRHPGNNFDPPLLAVAVEPLTEGAAATLLARLLARDAPLLPGFKPGRAIPWDRHLPGALALDFSFQRSIAGGGTYPVAGTTAILPLGDGRALVLTLLADVAARERHRWDLAVLAERLRNH